MLAAVAARAELLITSFKVNCDGEKAVFLNFLSVPADAHEANTLKELDDYTDIDKANYLEALAAERAKFDVVDPNVAFNAKASREKAVENDPSAVKPAALTAEKPKKAPGMSSGKGGGRMSLGK